MAGEVAMDGRLGYVEGQNEKKIAMVGGPRNFFELGGFDIIGLKFLRHGF